MARNLAEVELIATNPEPPTFENTIAALERAGRALDRAATIYDVYSSTMSDDAMQAVERDDGAEARRVPATRSRRTSRCSSASRRSTSCARSPASRPSSSASPGMYYTNFVRAGAKLDRGGEEAHGRDQPGARHALHELRPERAGRRGTTAWCTSTRRPTSPACRSRCATPRREAAGGRGQEGQVGRARTRARASSRSSPIRRPRPAREGLAHVRQPRRQRRRHRQQRDDHADPASCAPSARSCSATRRHAHWRLEDSMAQERRSARWR